MSYNPLTDLPTSPTEWRECARYQGAHDGRLMLEPNAGLFPRKYHSDYERAFWGSFDDAAARFRHGCDIDEAEARGD